MKKLFSLSFAADENKQEAVVEKDGTILKSKGRKLHIAKF